MTKRAYFRAWILCGALASLLGAAGPASAQPTTDPNKRATELYKKGNEFYDKSKWADAESMYRAAFELRQSYEIAGNLGDVEMIQGKAREAAEHLSFALRKFPESGKPAAKEALRKRLQDASNLIGTLNITASKPAAEIFVDGKAVGKSPLEYEVYVDKGDHTIEAKLEGFDPAKEAIQATPGSKHDVALTLKEKEKPKPPPAPPAPPPRSRGIFAGKSLPILIAGGAVTVVGIAVGAGAAVAANGKAEDADNLIKGMPANGCAPPVASGLSTSCGELYDARKDQDSLANTSMAMFIVGGAFGAATAGYLFLWPRSKPRAAATIAPVPVVTGRESGLWIKGTF